MDVSRYGDWATLAYTNVKVRENYSRRFRIRFPNEELPAGRPFRTTPIYDRLEAEHAVFGDYCGLEHPLWFAPTTAEASEEVTSALERAFARCRECAVVRQSVGLLEISNYGKFEVNRSGCSRVAVTSHGQPCAQRGPHRFDAHAQRAWQAESATFTICRPSQQRFF